MTSVQLWHDPFSFEGPTSTEVRAPQHANTGPRRMHLGARSRVCAVEVNRQLTLLGAYAAVLCFSSVTLLVSPCYRLGGALIILSPFIYAISTVPMAYLVVGWLASSFYVFVC